MTSIETGSSYIQETERMPLRGLEDILKTITYLQLPPDDFFVIGGANLVIRQVKDMTPDLDILVSQDLFDWLSTLDDAVVKDPPYAAMQRGANNKSIWFKNEFTRLPVSATTLLGDGHYPMSFTSHKSTVEIVRGIPCLPLDHVIATKEALQRPKDIIDLKEIAEFKEKQGVLVPQNILDPFQNS